jgi:predicted PhzF superfamily epimerase YddE/YHI9
MGGGRVRFRTRKAGVLEVRSGTAGYELDLPETLVEAAEHHALLDALGTPGGQVFLSVTGAEATAIILLEDEAAVRACAPDMSKLGQIELMAIVTAPGDTHDVVSRVFVPAWGVDEDPVTGSAHAALTPFWCERLGRDGFSAFQASRRSGAVQCRRVGERTVLGGACVTVLEGTLRF